MTSPASPTLQHMSSGSLVLALPMDTYAMAHSPRLRAGRHALDRKRELHVTVFDADTTARLESALGADTVQSRVRQGLGTPRRNGDGALMVDAQGGRASLVEWIALPGFDLLRAELARAAGIAIPSTLPHITQYASDHEGIGLPDMAAIRRLRAADLRLPGIAPRIPGTAPAQVRRSYADGCSVLPPDVNVHLDTPDPAIAHWLARHDAQAAWILSAADPFGEPAHKAGNALRWALLEDALGSAGVRSVPVPGQDDDDEPMHVSLCLLDADAALIDALLRDYEQLAAVHVPRQGAPALHLHPALRMRDDADADRACGSNA